MDFKVAESCRSACVLEIYGEAAADASDFNQQHITELNLRGKQNRWCLHPGKKKVKLEVSLLDRAQRIVKGAIRGRIHVTKFPHC